MAERNSSRINPLATISKRIDKLNNRIVERLRPWIKATLNGVLAVEEVVLFGIGATLMQIGEWFLAVCAFILFGFLLLAKSFTSDHWLEIVVGSIGSVLLSAILIVITVLHKPESDPWSNLQKPWFKPLSVLVMEAHMAGAWSPSVASSEIDFDIKNPPDDDIQNLELTISRASKKRIKQFSQISTVGDDCSFKPINDFQHDRVPLNGPNDSHLTLDSKEFVDEYFKLNGSVQWRLKCLRVSGRTSLLFKLMADGDAEKDFIIVSGKYERLQSEGGKAVLVSSRVLVTK
jgi:hypothetical protein